MLYCSKVKKSNFVVWNQKISYWLDKKFLPKEYSVDGLADYRTNVLPPLIGKGMRICDVGGGKLPYVSVTQKRQLDLQIYGLDIDADELSSAPKGAYDKTLVCDIAAYKPNQLPKVDLVICQAVLEHVEDTSSAVKSIASMLKKDGQAALFIPCRNGIFARINLVIPEKIKRLILFRIFPETTHAQGFPAYYNSCTPKDMISLCKQYNLSVTSLRGYYFVSYFSFFFPLHAAWRLYQLVARPFLGIQSADAFTLVVAKS